MPALAQPTPRRTPAEFLAWENEQPERHEFVDGEVYAMTGGSLNHVLIAGNLCHALRSRLPPRCVAYQSDAKVQVDADFFYPDVVVQCGAHDGLSTVVPNPTLLAEVLSTSTESYDRHHKWPRYQRLTDLQTFLLVAQDQVQVQHYRRRGGAWLYTLHDTLDSVLELAEHALVLPVRELYARVRGLDPAFVD